MTEVAADCADASHQLDLLEKKVYEARVQVIEYKVQILETEVKIARLKKESKALNIKKSMFYYQIMYLWCGLVL